VLRQGDTLMLCSDGLSGMVRFDEIRDVLMTTPDPLEACRILTERANQAGGHDNITVIVSKFDGQGLVASADLDDLKYKKYSLPEDPFTQGAESMPRQTIREPEGRPVSINAAAPGAVQIGERLSDHGPSRSKVTHTLVGAQMSQAALAALAARAPEPPPEASPAGWREGPRAGPEDSEPIFIPTSNAPAWMVGGVVLTALALALVAGYYLLR
jgi:PPM family protein phosphatase